MGRLGPFFMGSLYAFTASPPAVPNSEQITPIVLLLI
jgi:hypothetical protein